MRAFHIIIKKLGKILRDHLILFIQVTKPESIFIQENLQKNQMSILREVMMG